MSSPTRAPATSAAATPSDGSLGLPTGNEPEYPGRFRLLTKKDVAAVYSISIRCLENWIHEKKVPAPVYVGSKPYWHPERFFAHLSATTAGMAPAPAAGPAGDTSEEVSTTKAKRGRKGIQPPERAACATRLEERTQNKCDDIKRRLSQT